MTYRVGQMITFKPTPDSRYVTGIIDDVVHVDAERVQYHVRSVVTGGLYWVWHQNARPGGIQLALQLEGRM